ncbi:hypothetical protein SM092_000802 [Cronobacter sakazakii]|uniref:hypothetical protein n=1 Tax=Enterobacteriaceae TaxID=543 RepID=UPI000CFB6172|nr:MULTISPECIES: hypothetical protein [Enterobacteriaceae]ECS6015902.1 hypothetical protein [Salmonella enterica subsp. enterica serovar Rough O:k:1,5]EDX2368635.1 hypothetical protein [Salmonella enterica subsp. enterica serovar Memphis]EED8907389.1 hypothetical protein [Salmonella enterica subsp. enterica]EEQ8762664.1 hypothetical protein [Escherichia coli]EKP7191872.1 hypothetical protein [Salmonella enterica]HBL9972865.1 hypothetical protein [Salmonella enterica subsp. enterica serovar Ma
MSVIPCKKDLQLKKLIESYAEALKVEAHKLGAHGLTEAEFYDSGLFRGAIERIRGQFSATMRDKRNFVKHVLNYMQDNGYIADWESAGESNRHDYMVILNSGRKAAIELKGCLDGNNTNIFDRPPQAEEFVIWSVCTNPGADPQHNVWSGLHTRLSAEIISREQRIDGMVIWDWACGTVGRPCPKILNEPERAVTFGPFKLPPPCLYLLPSTIPSPRNNPSPKAQQLDDVQLIKAFHDCFGCRMEEVNSVNFDVGYHGKDTVRKTTIIRNGIVERESEMTAIRRS